MTFTNNNKKWLVSLPASLVLSNLVASDVITGVSISDFPEELLIKLLVFNFENQVSLKPACLEI